MSRSKKDSSALPSFIFIEEESHGLTRPTKGTVRIFGREFHKDRISILRRIGCLVEKPSYYGHLTGYENIDIARRMLNVSQSRINEVLKMVHLEKDKHKKVNKYSLGMKQRLGIATALLNQPEFLILDVPTNGLDPEGIHEIRNLIKELPQKFKVTILVSSHLLSEVEQMATSVGIIHHGHQLFQGSNTELKNKNKQRLIIKTDRSEEAESLLRQNHYSISRDHLFIYVDSPSQETVAQMQRLLIDNHFTIYQIQEEDTSLEQIFLKMVQDGEISS
nr:ABC transporter ATP-binding protein [Thermoactinomyces sp. CICC 10521]